VISLSGAGYAPRLESGPVVIRQQPREPFGDGFVKKPALGGLCVVCECGYLPPIIFFIFCISAIILSILSMTICFLGIFGMGFGGMDLGICLSLGIGIFMDCAPSG
jgi:hypothetical protein